MVRLGADVTEFGAIGPERAQRAIAAIRGQLAVARGLGVGMTLGMATEGVRRASNAQAFLDRVEAETGLRLAMISGVQEASLAFWGARSDTISDATSDATSAAGASGVLDLGGGSLELIVGMRDAIRWRASLPLGAGASRARLLPSDPPTFRELIGAYDAIRGDLAPLDLPLPVADVTVCGGTATARATVAGRAFRKHAERRGLTGDGRRRALTGATLDALIRLLLRFDAVELTRRYRLREGRAPLLISGALTLYAGMERFGVERLWVSRRGIREGAIIAWRRAGAEWLDAAERGQLNDAPRGEHGA